VPAKAPDALSSAIAELADDPQGRTELARASRAFYQQHLSNETANKQFAKSLSSLIA
jgi:glycosyltransferase involved in cell wall biosynthesis